MNLYELTERILRRMAARQRVGWVDFSSCSWDRRVATARALRIVARQRGERMSWRVAMAGG